MGNTRCLRWPLVLHRKVIRTENVGHLVPVFSDDQPARPQAERHWLIFGVIVRVGGAVLGGGLTGGDFLTLSFDKYPFSSLGASEFPLANYAVELGATYPIIGGTAYTAANGTTLRQSHIQKLYLPHPDRLSLQFSFADPNTVLNYQETQILYVEEQGCVSFEGLM